VGHHPSSELIVVKNGGFAGDVLDLAEIGMKNCEVVKSETMKHDGENFFDEGLRNVHDEERVEESWFETGSCDVEVMQRGSVTTNEGQIGHEGLSGSIKSGVTRRRLPN